ncbi:unnamed protein product [Lactuca saligna]|uniref:Uncharacterized protein n=1 Tax=Lactuca saligna TaxID=75948 RepID=A0AA35V2A5_LACSI|nr:unnamed protein product [Lactuca saligna]
MTRSYETPSFQEQTRQSLLHAIKPNQNLVIDLDPCKYDSYLLPIVECLKYSALITALTKTKSVPMSLRRLTLLHVISRKNRESLLKFTLEPPPSPNLAFAQSYGLLKQMT